MVELKMGLRTVDLPYTVRVHGVTEADFDEWVDEDTKAELLDGVMIVHSPATPRHDDLAGFLRALMRIVADERQQGKVLGPDSVIHLASCRKFAPDLFFVEQRRLRRRLPKKEFQGSPNLIAEFLSHFNREYDLEEKRPAYQEAGVDEIWLVDAENEEVIVDRRRGRRYVTECVTRGRVSSLALPGFWIEATWLWSEPLPNLMTCLRAILGE
ncbi:MAG TPA: Uma2 family endonuclease [Gemmataceae bacterium]|nr:Uma2 family endonuclease [Gemmataceae bacterium]